MHLIEAQDNPVARFAKEVATRIVTAHLATVARIGVFYDLLNWESDIFLRGFWQTAFESLKAAGGIVYETEGPNAGCWVVKMGRGVTHTANGVRSEDKVLVRSNGTVVYTGKDIAYQMWKFGVLGQDFLYKLWGVQANGDELWTTSPDGEPLDRFGRAEKVINVIDVRQSYLQQVVYDCLRKLGFRKEARNSKHLDYEVVVLSNAAAAELGVDVDAEEPGTQAMSGRKGVGVKADDLLDAMVKRLSEKVATERNAHVLAAAAIRYFMSRISTGKMIVFDFDEALRTTGDTGVYCQYAHARACSILAKARQMGNGEWGMGNTAAIPEAGVTIPEENLVKKIAEFGSVLRKAGQELSPAPLAHYAFELATVFTEFYETPDPDAEKQTPFIKIRTPCFAPTASPWWTHSARPWPTASTRWGSSRWRGYRRSLTWNNSRHAVRKPSGQANTLNQCERGITMLAADADSVRVSVDATDALAGVASVSADGVTLTKTGASTWVGEIVAAGELGTHHMTVVATDAVGNSVTDTTAAYTTARVVGASSWCAWDRIMKNACGNYLFRFWGRVFEGDDEFFILDDGSPVSVWVHAPGYRSVVQTGDYASARGMLSIFGGARWIESAAGFVTRY